MSFLDAFQTTQEQDREFNYLTGNKLNEQGTDIIISNVCEGNKPLKKVVFWAEKSPYISQKTFKEQCPLDDELLSFYKAYTKDSPERTALKSQNRTFSKKQPTDLVVYILNGDEVDTTPVVLSCGSALADAISSILSSPPKGTNADDFILTENGQQVYPITISKSGSGLNTKYQAQMHLSKFEVDCIEAVESAKGIDLLGLARAEATRKPIDDALAYFKDTVIPSCLSGEVSDSI